MKKLRTIANLVMILFFCFILNNKSIAIDATSENADKNPAKITMEYSYKKETNTVLTTVKSDKELKATKASWKLSDDKKQYTFEFNTNTKYTTNFTDINGNVIPVQINVTQVDMSPAKLTIEYTYKKETNTVLATVKSNKELKATKSSWKLSTDKKQYTFEFNTNTKYVTNFVDIYGNVIPVQINVTQVDTSSAKLTIEYTYKKETNTVLATVKSNKELKATKASWKLSADKKQYTFEFNTNVKYTTNFTDIYGNVIPVQINITQVNETTINVSYNYKSDTNTVIATVSSSNGFKATKASWKLSADKKQYTFEFTTNSRYTTNFTDGYGRVIPVEINVTQIIETVMKVSYNYKSDTNTVIVTVTSNNEFKPTKVSWKLSADKKSYSFEFSTNTKYTTTFMDKFGKSVQVQIDVTQVKMLTEQGTYGISGAKAKGVSGGSNLEYFRYGQGPNVMFATFCVHGYEDSWSRDGTALVNIANDFYKRLVSDNDSTLANKWTVYIFPEVNPDGRRLGYTNNGPGRTTLYSEIGKGMDINRSWQTGSNYIMYTDARNYNGTAGFQAYEASALRNFLLSHKSKTGQTVLVDLHGWEDQLIGDAQIGQYYKQQYTSCSTRNYGNYGTQYLISWARQNLGAKVALVELPKASSQVQANSMGLSQKYINATLNMLRGI